MKKIVLITLTILTIHSCGKDDESKVLETPSFEWNPISVSENALEISITINSSGDLPEGILEFKVDGNRINSFQAIKGTKVYNTDYNFIDMETHTASLSFMFSGGRNALNKTINIKKSLQKVSQKSSKNDWVDF